MARICDIVITDVDFATPPLELLILIVSDTFFLLVLKWF